MQFVRPRPRHAIAGVVLTLCAGVALAGCRSQPDVAAYVGDKTLSEQHIDAVVQDAKDKIAAAGAKEDRVPTRTDVVTTFVLGQSCEKLRAAKGFPLADVTTDAVAASDRVPANTIYVNERATAYKCLAGIKVDQLAEPTDAELRDIYDRAAAANLVHVPYSEIKPQLAQDQGVRQAVAVNRALTEMVKAGDVSVNPRYRPLEFTVDELQSGVPLVVLLMGEPGSAAVRDLAPTG